MHVNIWRAKVNGKKDWKKIYHIQPHDLQLHANIPYVHYIYIICTPYMMLHLHHILVYDNVYTHITQTTKIWLQLWPKEQWYFFNLHPSWLDVCRHKFVDNLIVPFFEWGWCFFLNYFGECKVGRCITLYRGIWLIINV